MENQKSKLEIEKVKTTCMYLFRKAVRYKPGFLLVYILDIIVKSISPFINIVFSKFLIEELVGARNINVLVLDVTCIVLGNFIVHYSSAFLQETINKNYYDDFSKYFDAMLGRKIMQLPYQSTEDKAVLERIQKAKDGLGTYSGGVGGIASSVSQIIAHFLS